MEASKQASDGTRKSASKRERWNQRYGASELVWGADPNRFVAEAFGASEPRGAALDLACGEGRNALWLASRGWSVTGVDFAHVALARARQRAARQGVEVRWIEADVLSWSPDPERFELVLVAYLQLPRSEMQHVWRTAAGALAPGGELFAIGHAAGNLSGGVGGPQDPDVLWELDPIVGELRAAGLEVDAAEDVQRPIDGAPRPAIDTLIRARRPLRPSALATSPF